VPTPSCRLVRAGRQASACAGDADARACYRPCWSEARSEDRADGLSCPGSSWRAWLWSCS
jgi:hypothetical protein